MLKRKAQAQQSQQPKTVSDIHDELKPFIQHGLQYTPENKTGKQIFTVCPFCGHLAHKHKHTFYMNYETHNWQCKSCHREGGFRDYLKELVLFGQDNFKRGIALSLSEDRAISLKVLRKWGVGYNPLNGSYIVPLYDSNHDQIWNIYKYKQNKFMHGTSTCKHGLYGWDQGIDSANTIFICEGQWDTMAMSEILSANDRKNDIAVGTVGSGAFRSEWTTLFSDKNVVVVFDNDAAGKGEYNKEGIGRGGCIAIYNNLKAIAKSLMFVHWPEDYEQGFDLSDFYKLKKKKPKTTLHTLSSFLHETPPEIPIPEGVKPKEDEIDRITGKGLTVRTIYEKYRKWMLVKDTDVIDVIYGAMIANRMPGDPVWLFIVAPPGGSKSEYLMSLNDAPLVTTLTSMTPKVLVSGATGFGGSDPSLLPKLNNRVLIIKDLTTMLKMNKQERDEILGTLRDAYDGKLEKMFGIGTLRKYESHFGVIAGVTPVIEMETESDSILGERFIRYNMPAYKNANDMKEVVIKAMRNVGQENQMRADLKEIGKQTLNKKFDVVPEFPEEIFFKIVTLAQWTSMVRGHVSRDKWHDTVTHLPVQEVATRIAKVYKKLAIGIAQFRGAASVDQKIYQVIVHTAKSTVPSRNEIVIKKMWERGHKRVFTTDEIVAAVKLPTMTCRKIIDNLSLLGAIDKIQNEGLRGMMFKLSKNMVEMITFSNIY